MEWKNASKHSPPFENKYYLVMYFKPKEGRRMAVMKWSEQTNSVATKRTFGWLSGTIPYKYIQYWMELPRFPNE